MPRLSSHFGLNDPRLQSVAFPLTQVATIPGDANQTLTPAQVLSGFIIRGGSMTAARTDTLPSAAALCEAIQGVMVNTSFELPIRNAATGAFAITLAAGPGGTMFDPAGALRQIAQSTTKFFQVVFNNVTVGQEAYTVYSLGGGTT